MLRRALLVILLVLATGLACLLWAQAHSCEALTAAASDALAEANVCSSIPGCVVPFPDVRRIRRAVMAKVAACPADKADP